MPTNHTENYQLSQWERSDRIQMEDFNSDNAKIDAALTQLQATALRIHTGLYIGEGKPEKTIELPFTPKFMWLERYPNQRMRIILTDKGLFLVRQFNEQPRASGNGEGVIVTQNGSTIHLEGLSALPANQRPILAMNELNVHYLYVAFG